MKLKKNYMRAIAKVILFATCLQFAFSGVSNYTRSKFILDVSGSFPDAVPDTMLVMSGKGAAIDTMTRQKAGSNVFIGRGGIEILDSYMLMPQRGSDTLYRRHEMMRHNDGTHQLWMPDTLNTAPTIPFASYPYLWLQDGKITRSASQAVLENPWTFVKIQWAFAIKEPSYMTITSDRGICGWLDYDGTSVIANDSTSLRSLYVRVKPGDKFLWIAIPSGQNRKIKVSLKGMAFNFSDVKLKPGKNITLTLQKRTPAFGFLRVNMCQLDDAYHLHFTANERLGWKRYVNKMPTPGKIPKNTVAFQYVTQRAAPRKSVDFFCFGLKPNVTYDIKVDVSCPLGKVFETLYFNNIKVGPEQSETIEVCPDALLLADASKREDASSPCACIQRGDTLPLKKIRANIIEKLDISPANRGKVHERHDSTKRELMFIGEVQPTYDMSKFAIGMTLQAINDGPWQKKLNVNNPFIKKYRKPTKRETYIGLPSPAPKASELPTPNENSSIELVIKNCDELQSLFIANCDVDKIVIRDCPNLKSVALPFNSLSHLVILCCPQLEAVVVPGNHLQELRIQCCPQLEAILAPYNRLSYVDLHNFPMLTELDVSNNEFTSLNTTKNTALEKLACVYNRLQQLDLQNNHELRWLSCTANDNIEVLLPDPSAIVKYNINGSLIDKTKQRPIKFDEEYEAE